MERGIVHSLAACALLLAGLVGTAAAVEPPNLYTAEVAYDSQLRDARALAYERALLQVLARMTTEPLIASELIPDAGVFVLGWRESGRDSLWVSFDGAALGATLQSAGIPVWGSDRPLTLVWLGIEHPDGTREILSMAPPAPEDDLYPELREDRAVLRTELKEAAAAFGLPLSLPVLDETDQAAVAVSDVWGGFDNVLRSASRRYRADSVLIGRASLDTPEIIRWRWLFGGDVVNLQGESMTAMNRVAAEMLDQFAARPEESSEVRVSIVGVRDAKDYAELMRFLQSRSLIDDIRVTTLRQDELTVTLDALATRDRLAELLVGEELETMTAPLLAPSAVATADLYFRWRMSSEQ
ncbi:MAG: DUF2066 domain-containing protein [Pseudomonadota bacterium]